MFDALTRFAAVALSGAVAAIIGAGLAGVVALACGSGFNAYIPAAFAVLGLGASAVNVLNE